MPKAFERELKKRRGAVRWRTILLPNGSYAHIAITKKAGKRGGRTLLGETHKRMRI